MYARAHLAFPPRTRSEIVPSSFCPLLEKSEASFSRPGKGIGQFKKGNVPKSPSLPSSASIARNEGMVPRRTCVHCRPLRGHRSRFTCPPRKNRALRFLETGRSFFLASPPLSPDTVQWRYNVEWPGEPSQGHRRTMRSKPGDAADNETDR